MPFNVVSRVLWGASMAFVIGDSGNNVLNGTDFSDDIYGLEGNDVLNGGLGNDSLYAGEGDDTVNGDGGDDTIFASYGSDSFNGGPGIDTYNIANSPVANFGFTIDLNTGSDQYGNIVSGIVPPNRSETGLHSFKPRPEAPRDRAPSASRRALPHPAPPLPTARAARPARRGDRQTGRAYAA